MSIAMSMSIMATAAHMSMSTRATAMDTVAAMEVMTMITRKK